MEWVGNEHLTETAGLALRLEQGNNVVFTDRADDVADNGTLTIQEFGTNLGDTTTGAGTAQTLEDAGVFDFILRNISTLLRRIK
jgi:hypothetical protein